MFTNFKYKNPNKYIIKKKKKKRSKKQFIQLSDETNTEILDSISLLEKFNVLTQLLISLPP